jgi:hypothetical protein
MPPDRFDDKPLPPVRRIPRSDINVASGNSDQTTSDDAAPPPSDDLSRYRRSEITAEQYLESRIDQATLHLRGRVSSRKLDRIRAIVKRMCSSDPAILAMKERLLRTPIGRGKK